MACIVQLGHPKANPFRCCRRRRHSAGRSGGSGWGAVSPTPPPPPPCARRKAATLFPYFFALPHGFAPPCESAGGRGQRQADPRGQWGGPERVVPPVPTAPPRGGRRRDSHEHPGVGQAPPRPKGLGVRAGACILHVRLVSLRAESAVRLPAQLCSAFGPRGAALPPPIELGTARNYNCSKRLWCRVSVTPPPGRGRWGREPGPGRRSSSSP